MSERAREREVENDGVESLPPIHSFCHLDSSWNTPRNIELERERFWEIEIDNTFQSDWSKQLTTNQHKRGSRSVIYLAALTESVTDHTDSIISSVIIEGTTTSTTAKEQHHLYLSPGQVDTINIGPGTMQSVFSDTAQYTAGEIE